MPITLIWQRVSGVEGMLMQQSPEAKKKRKKVLTTFDILSRNSQRTQ